MSRNGFNDCEREYNRKEEAVEMAREERRWSMSDTPKTDEIWGSMHGSGYQMMLLAQKLERELAEIQNAFENAVTAREKAEAELANYKLWAEVEIADLRDDLSDHIRMAKDAQEELAACKANADRYRWLRDMNNDDAAMRCVQLCGAAMDEAIDEAIAGSAT